MCNTGNELRKKVKTTNKIFNLKLHVYLFVVALFILTMISNFPPMNIWTSI